jgi:uncharacterized circularly permuted ATP-grasp superfamily protein
VEVTVTRLRETVRAAPGEFIVQRLVQISLHANVIDGELRPRHVDLRPFVFMRGSGQLDLLPGGLTRVAFGQGAIVVNSTQDGGAKDTWILP